MPPKPVKKRGHTARIRMGVDHAAEEFSRIDEGKAAGEASAERHERIAVNVDAIMNGRDVSDGAATIQTVDIERVEPRCDGELGEVASPLNCKLIWASSSKGVGAASVRWPPEPENSTVCALAISVTLIVCVS